MTLSLHPFDPKLHSGSRVEVFFEVVANKLRLEYRLSGEIDSLKIPAPKNAASKIDGLYRHTCFEVFLGFQGDRYEEWNFSPSGDWGHFEFVAYRKPSEDTGVSYAPRSIVKSTAEHLSLAVDIPLAEIPNRIALSTVIEGNDGVLSYWALAHPAAKPDFHDPKSFIRI